MKPEIWILIKAQKGRPEFFIGEFSTSDKPVFSFDILLAYKYDTYAKGKVAQSLFMEQYKINTILSDKYNELKDMYNLS